MGETWCWHAFIPAFYHHFNGSELRKHLKNPWDIDKNIQNPSNVLSFLEIFYDFCLGSSKNPWKIWSKTHQLPRDSHGFPPTHPPESTGGASPGTADRSFCSLGVSFAESAKTRRLHLRPESHTPNDTINGS